MRIFDISILGWIHSLACMIALPTGLAALVFAKGTGRHRQVGLWYFYAMVAANITALGLFAPIPGIEPGFNRFHWMAVFTLIALGMAYVGARRQRQVLWAYLHPAGMIVSYYFLIGGAINEAFSRVDALQAFRGPPLDMAQGLNMFVFTVLLIVAATRISRRRGRMAATA